MKKSKFKLWLAITTVSGLITLAIASIITGHNSFFNIEGLVIVIGGSVANAYLSYEREDVIEAFNTIRNMLQKNKPSKELLHNDILQFIKWSYILQSQDLIGLERATATIKDEFLRYGIDLVVTGYTSAQIRPMMHTVADAEFERLCTPVTVLRNMAATAPAFGMVGTLVGMVILLQNVGADVKTIGGGLGIAMLSTLYGILAARLVCLPAADKLLQKQENDRFRNYMLSEGLAILAEKQSTFYMQDKLNSFLSPSKHFTLDDSKQIALHRQFASAA